MKRSAVTSGRQAGTRVARVPIQPMLRQLQRKLAREIAARRFQMAQPIEAVQRRGKLRARRGLIEDRALPYVDRLTGQAETAAHQRVGILQHAHAMIVRVRMNAVGHRAASACWR